MGRIFMTFQSALIVVLSIGIFYCHSAEHEWLRARIWTNVDDKTPLNHGQQTIEVVLPRDVVFTSWGDCNPQWRYGAGANAPLVWDHFVCDIEKYDPRIEGYKPWHPGQDWPNQ